MATDDFNRPDANPLDGSWQNGEGNFHDCRIVSNRARAAAASQECLARRTDVFNADQYSQAIITTLASASWASVVVRKQDSVDESCYFFVGTDTGNIWRVYEVSDAFGFTILDSGTFSWSIPDTIRLEIEGSTLDYKVNGASQGTTVDATITSGRPGIHFFSGTPGQSELDDWEGGNLVDPVEPDEDEEQSIVPPASADDQGPMHPRYIRIQNSLFLDKKIDGDVMITIGYREVPIGTN